MMFKEIQILYEKVHKEKLHLILMFYKFCQLIELDDFDIFSFKGREKLRNKINMEKICSDLEQYTKYLIQFFIIFFFIVYNNSMWIKIS